MLLEFRVTNFRSVCDEQVLSLVPAVKQKEYTANVLKNGRYEALNALALYGPNDGGKSNLLRAIEVLDMMVHLSSSWSSTTFMPHDPFLLRVGWETKPTELEATFVVDGKRYRYGVAYTASGVNQEWLFRKVVGREVVLFERQGDTIEVGKGFVTSSPKQKLQLETAIESTRPNALFLSVCDQFNLPEAKQIMQWFARLNNIDGSNTQEARRRTAQLLREPNFAQPIRDYLASLSLKVLEVEITDRKFDENELPQNMPQELRGEFSKALQGKTAPIVQAKHRVYDANGKPTADTITWDWAGRESAGALKALELSGDVIWALTYGGVLIVDEIEAKMHTLVTLNVINLFLNPATNPNGAQLLFATHDTNLLTYAKLRRDQICFAEKNKWEGTETYALSDFQYLPSATSQKSAVERPDTDKEKRYFEGRYGAVPASADFQRFIKQHQRWPTPVK